MNYPDPHLTDFFECTRCERTFEDLVGPTLPPSPPVPGWVAKAWCPHCDRQVAIRRGRRYGPCLNVLHNDLNCDHLSLAERCANCRGRR